MVVCDQVFQTLLHVADDQGQDNLIVGRAIIINSAYLYHYQQYIMTSYKAKNLYFSYFVFFVLLISGVLALFVTLFDIIPTSPPDDKPGALIFIVCWILMICVLFYWYMRIPTVIIVDNGGTIILRSPVRTISLSPSQLQEIKYDGDSMWLYHHQGKLQLHSRYKRLGGFLKWLKQVNPKVHISVAN